MLEAVNNHEEVPSGDPLATFLGEDLWGEEIPLLVVGIPF